VLTAHSGPERAGQRPARPLARTIGCRCAVPRS